MEDALLCLPTAIHNNYSMHAEAKETEAPLFQVTVSSEFHVYFSLQEQRVPHIRSLFPAEPWASF